MLLYTLPLAFMVFQPFSTFHLHLVSPFVSLPRSFPTCYSEAALSTPLVSVHSVHAKLLSHVRLCVILWTVARQAPLSMGSSRQEYWSGLLCPPPEDLPHPGIKPMSFTSHALADGFFTTSTLLLLLLSRFSSVQLCATP